MAEAQVYDNIGLLEEAQRYKTSIEFLELLYNKFNESKKLFIDGLGARLLTTSSALTEELYGIDVNPGSIQRAEEFIRNWKHYRNKEPFKTEFDFLKQKGLIPKFKEHHFYLQNDFPSHLKDFDGELASELFLHLELDEVEAILDNAYTRLRPEGKMVFTVYPTDHPESLDELFSQLGSAIGIRREKFIAGGVVDIQSLAEQLRRKNESFYDENRDKYWLDLSKVRVFSVNEIEEHCKKAGFVIEDVSYIKGGMFSLAHRATYTLRK